jgi:uncharacterized membrane protein
MNLAHVHLLLNHLPVIGVLFALALLVVALLRRSVELTKAALWTTAIVGALAVPAYLTGEPAEEYITGLSKAPVERHEEAAGVALAAVAFAGAAALLHLVLFRRVGIAPAVVVAILALVAAGLLARTANLGGAIHHTEISAAAPAGVDGGGARERDHDD